MYLITDNKGSYIRRDPSSGKYVPVKSIQYAEIWDDECRARNVLQNSLSKRLQAVYRVRVTEAQEQVDGTIEAQPPVNAHPISVQTEDPKVDRISDELRRVYGLLQHLPRGEELLKQDLRDIENHALDVRHYIEFGHFNAAQGYKAMKLYQDILRRRRRIKNELQVIAILKESNLNAEDLLHILQSIDNIQHQSYMPRVAPELFEGLSA